MKAEIQIGTVEDGWGAKAKVITDPCARTVDVYVAESRAETVLSLPPYRARALISLLQEALRHLED